MSKDGRPPRDIEICTSCGGTGCDNGAVDEPGLSKLDPEDRGVWREQLRNRPEIYLSIDTLLAARRDLKLLEDQPPVGQFIGEVSEDASTLFMQVETIRQLPDDEQGKYREDLFFALSIMASDIVWFMAAHGYPKRDAMSRFLKSLPEDEDD